MNYHERGSVLDLSSSGRGLQQTLLILAYLYANPGAVLLFDEPDAHLEIPQAFARRFDHLDGIRALARPYVRYIRNQPSAARGHYYGLKEALPDLKAAALFDRLDRQPGESGSDLRIGVWQRQEIENYLCSHATLEAYVRGTVEKELEDQPLFIQSECNRRLEAMRQAIDEVETAMETLGRGSPWSTDAKVSDDFLSPVFQRYFEKLGLPNLMNKKDFYELADYVPYNELDSDVREKLDMISLVAREATPAE